MPEILINHGKLMVAVGCGLFWSVAYLLVIRRGFIDRTYGMPVSAVCMNIAWELLCATILKQKSPVGGIIPIIWLGLDVIILLQCFYYQKRELPSVPAPIYLGFVFAGIGLSGVLLYFATTENVRVLASSFFQNLVMSILFIGMLYSRDDCRGQSIYIALFKMLGTAIPISTLLPTMLSRSPLYSTVLVSTLFFDLAYVVLLWGRLSSLGIRPWRRL